MPLRGEKRTAVGNCVRLTAPAQAFSPNCLDYKGTHGHTGTPCFPPPPTPTLTPGGQGKANTTVPKFMARRTWDFHCYGGVFVVTVIACVRALVHMSVCVHVRA